MNDSFVMSGGQAIGDLRHQSEQPFHWKRAVFHLIPKTLPFDELHGDERSPAEITNRIDRDDVGMVQCGCRPGFLREAAEMLRAGEQALLKNLDGDFAAKTGIPRPIDTPHAAGAEDADNL